MFLGNLFNFESILILIDTCIQRYCCTDDLQMHSLIGVVWKGGDSTRLAARIWKQDCTAKSGTYNRNNLGILLIHTHGADCQRRWLGTPSNVTVQGVSKKW